MTQELHQLKDDPASATAEDVAVLLKLLEDQQRVMAAQYKSLTELREQLKIVQSVQIRELSPMDAELSEIRPKLPEDVITLLNELRYHVRARQEDGSGYWQKRLTETIEKYNCERAKAQTPDVML